MKILLLDIETSPNVAYVWRLKADYIPVDHLVASSYILCVSAMWLGQKTPMFTSIKKDGKVKMLKTVHRWLSEADVVVHYNGKKFDVPTLQREFVEENIAPPSPPFKQVDLYHVVRHQFRFVSNKLDYVCGRLGLGVKVQHKGMQLWRDCMAGNAQAWATMEKYNVRDVVLLNKLYKHLAPWVMQHRPSAAALKPRKGVS